jgi:hypothetical protein
MKKLMIFMNLMLVTLIAKAESYEEVMKAAQEYDAQQRSDYWMSLGVHSLIGIGIIVAIVWATNTLKKK